MLLRTSSSTAATAAASKLCAPLSSAVSAFSSHVRLTQPLCSRTSAAYSSSSIASTASTATSSSRFLSTSSTTTLKSSTTTLNGGNILTPLATIQSTCVMHTSRESKLVKEYAPTELLADTERWYHGGHMKPLAGVAMVLCMQAKVKKGATSLKDAVFTGEAIPTTGTWSIDGKYCLTAVPSNALPAQKKAEEGYEYLSVYMASTDANPSMNATHYQNATNGWYRYELDTKVTEQVRQSGESDVRVVVLKVHSDSAETAATLAHRLHIEPLISASQNDCATDSRVYTGGYPAPVTTEQLRAQRSDLTVAMVEKYFGGRFSHFTLTKGNVSNPTAKSQTTMMQHSCDTLTGFSGGPVFNVKGQLVGVHLGGQKSAQQNVLYSCVNNKPFDAVLKEKFGTIGAK